MLTDFDILKKFKKEHNILFIINFYRNKNIPSNMIPFYLFYSLKNIDEYHLEFLMIIKIYLKEYLPGIFSEYFKVLQTNSKEEIIYKSIIYITNNCILDEITLKNILIFFKNYKKNEILTPFEHKNNLRNIIFKTTNINNNEIKMYKNLIIHYKGSDRFIFLLKLIYFLNNEEYQELNTFINLKLTHDNEIHVYFFVIIEILIDLGKYIYKEYRRCNQKNI